MFVSLEVTDEVGDLREVAALVRAVLGNYAMAPFGAAPPTQGEAATLARALGIALGHDDDNLARVHLDGIKRRYYRPSLAATLGSSKINPSIQTPDST